MGSAAEFVNHSSLLLRAGTHYLLTDPWVLTPAFGTWIPEPGPNDSAIQRINQLGAESLSILVSHGHDDHLDEFWLSANLRHCDVLIPTLPNMGLFRRIEKLTGHQPLQFDAAGRFHDGYFISAHQNEKFTDSDSIVVIQTDSVNIIHANDNWHSYPETLITEITNQLSRNQSVPTFYFVQFGIADCFPMNHEEFSHEEKLAIVQERLAEYQEATERNLAQLGCDQGFYYANQSRYQYPVNWDGPSAFELALNFISRNGSSFVQLFPGEIIDESGRIKPPTSTASFLDEQLQRMSQFVNSRLTGDLRVEFLSEPHRHSSLPNRGIQHNDGARVQLVASKLTWSRILSGDLTLESIIIGGAGTIRRPRESISDLHRQLSSLAYSLQRMIREQGLRAFADV